MLEKCCNCFYRGDALLGRCTYHAQFPDETTHDGFAPEMLEPAAGALELAIERPGPPEVIGEPPCETCAQNRFCIEHTGKSRRPYVAPTVVDVTSTEAERLRGEILAGAHPDLAAPVSDEETSPPTPRDPGTSKQKKPKNR